MQFLQKGQLLLLLKRRIDSFELVGLELEYVLGKSHGFLELDGAAVEATDLRDGQLLTAPNIILEDALASTELQDFPLHGCLNYNYITIGVGWWVVIISYMERNKSVKEAQSQLLKEVLAEFDIETQVNKIALRCFNDLMRSNKQAFDIIAQSQRKITEFETRLCKTEGFAESIEKNVSSKIEIANNLNRRLETFSAEFYAGLKQNAQLVVSMRKDYDSLVTSSQKNTYELRSISDSLKKDAQSIKDMERKVAEDLAAFSFKVNDHQLQSEKQFVQVRADQQSLRTSLTEARTHFLSKSQIFQNVSKDMELYKHEKDTINRRLIDIVNEVELKTNKSDFNQFRLLLDSRLVTEHDHFSRITSDLRSQLKDQKEQRKEVVKNIISDSSTRWDQQQATNMSVHGRLGDLRDEFTAKVEKLNSRVDSLEIALRKDIESINKKQARDIEWTREELRKEGDKIQSHSTKLVDNEKFMQQRYEESIEMNSTLNALAERVEDIVRQNNERRRQMASHNPNELGDSVNSLNDVITRIQQQLYEVNKNINTLTRESTQSKKKHEDLQSQLQKQEKSLLGVINSEKTESLGRFTEINRHINQVSIQIMNNVHASQLECKQYTDELIESIKKKLQFLDIVSKQIRQLQQAFQDQMKETKAINQSITEKMEKSNSNMIKFKSDLSLRVDAIINEQQRRSLQTKEIGKQVEDSRKHLGYLTEGLVIALSILTHREYLEDNEGIKEIKVSSLLQGWVLEIDEKQARYRGQHFHRRKLVAAYLNFLVFHSDKVKGTLIESGKDIYIRMMEENQQIFTNRKKGFSRKLGSQLPKLHL